MSGLSVGTAALLGGGAYLLSRKRKRPDIPAYTGIRPFESLREISETPDFLAELARRRKGEGVGFRPEVLSAATSPFAATQRAALRERTIPTISAQASARGLGRSTIPVGQIGQASAATERDIGERIAQLQLANEQQRRQEINQALSSTGQFIGAEAAQRGTRAGFDLSDFQQTRGLNVQTEQFREQQKQQDFQNLLALGSLGVSGGTLAAKIKGVGGFAPTSFFGPPTTGAGTPVTQTAGGGATVNIGGQRVTFTQEELLEAQRQANQLRR